MKKICISKDWYFSLAERDEYTELDLPHDYIISMPRNPNCAGWAATGFFDSAHGKYTKYLALGNDEHVILDIDGASMGSRVSFNERLLVVHPNGYTPFLTDLTPIMRKGRINKLEVVMQDMQPSTRWYSGAGIYRDVFIWTGGKIRIEPRDIFIITRSASKFNASVSAEIEITSDIDANILLKTHIQNPSGEEITAKNVQLEVKKGKSKLELVYEIKEPQLWSVETPQIYSLSAEIVLDSEVEDVSKETFGIRTLSADAQNGLLLNGEPIKLRGGCIHHDHGALGAAAFPAAEYRKISKLKAVGFNAVRIAHNPPSLALLEACDRLGMLVMDEAFDMWTKHKKIFDYSLWFTDWWERDINSMVLRDRNHPCVISYSIGNEIPELNSNSGGAFWAEKLSAQIRKYDTTRLVTSGICGLWEEADENAPNEYKKDFMLGYEDIGRGGIDTSWDKRTEEYMKHLDIVGYNYLYKRYEYDHKNYPERVIWGSETHAIDFYHSWKAVLKNSHVIGDFTWTAYDNLGEAGAGRFAWKRDGVINGISLADYPWRSCYQGDLDLCGYRRPQSYFREAIWKENCEPKIFTTHPEHFGEDFSGTGWHWYDVSDSWSFDDKYIGKPVKAEVYTDADEIHFVLNGKEAAVAKPIDGIASAVIPYEKGELTAVSYKEGVKIKSSSLHTVGLPKTIKIIPEKHRLTADNRDLCYFEIYVADENDNRVPYAENELFCTCCGGELMCIFSGNPANEDQYTSNCCHAFEGRALAVVRATKSGDVTLNISGTGLEHAFVTVQAI